MLWLPGSVTRDPGSDLTAGFWLKRFDDSAIQGFED